jgi:hypothetical protein
MDRSIDIKSFLIGGLLATLILCLVGAVPLVAPEEYGRFEIETNDGYAFVLDSATGQVWSSMFLSPATGLVVGHDPNFHVPKTLHADVSP